ncbi:MAG: heme-degrading domain-containing protein [Pseudomonadota bacterium]
MESEKDILEQLAEEERELGFTTFSIAKGQQIGAALQQVAIKESLPIAIDVTRNRQCLFHCAMEGASIDNAEWIVRKNRVAHRFGHSSLYMGTLCRVNGVVLEEKYQLPANTYAPFGGSFPIRIKETGVIGTVAISGLPQSEDHALMVKTIRENLE